MLVAFSYSLYLAWLACNAPLRNLYDSHDPPVFRARDDILDMYRLISFERIAQNIKRAVMSRSVGAGSETKAEGRVGVRV